jgi:hypothetical protein
MISTVLYRSKMWVKNRGPYDFESRQQNVDQNHNIKTANTRTSFGIVARYNI